MDDAKLADSKAAFHRRQADLPFEEKIRAVVRMQQAAREIARATGRPGPRHVWDISDLDRPPDRPDGLHAAGGVRESRSADAQQDSNAAATRCRSSADRLDEDGRHSPRSNRRSPTDPP